MILNGNGLVDPADKWGAYVSEPGVSGNPIFVEDQWLTDIHIEIPHRGWRSALECCSVCEHLRRFGFARIGER